MSKELTDHERAELLLERLEHITMTKLVPRVQVIDAIGDALCALRLHLKTKQATSPTP